VLAASFLTMLGVGTVVVWLVFVRDETEKVTGTLEGVRAVSFTEGTQKDGGISPVCGCNRPPVNAWRGVTFAGREVTISRTGRSPWTEWVLSGADPDTVTLSGFTNRMTINAVRLRPRGDFNPRWLVDGRLDAHAQVLGRTTVKAFRTTFITRNDLHVAMLGPVPVGAWIPFPGSKVDLGTRTSPFPGEPESPFLVERYPSDIGYTKKVGHQTQPQAYPLGDFLGQPLVLWTRDSGARIPATPFGRPSKRGVVTALYIGRSIFSTRIAAVPLSNEELRGRYQYDKRESHFDRLQQVTFGWSDGGSVRVTVSRPLSEAAYAAVRARVSARPRIWVTSQADVYEVAPNGAAVPAPPPHGQPDPVAPYSELERYPPLPRYVGFNVFGPLDRVLFRLVRGHVAVGDRPLDLSSSADLELYNVRGLRNADDQQLLLAPLATSGQSARLAFRAVGSVKVNGVRQTTFWKRHGDAVGLAGFILTLVGVVLAVAGFLQGMHVFEAKPN
jgi:hypothetical protein